MVGCGDDTFVLITRQQPTKRCILGNYIAALNFSILDYSEHDVTA
jgi:hypothetical protein